MYYCNVSVFALHPTHIRNNILNYEWVYTKGDQKVCGKVLLNHIAFIDCFENSKI